MLGCMCRFSNLECLTILSTCTTSVNIMVWKEISSTKHINMQYAITEAAMHMEQCNNKQQTLCTHTQQKRVSAVSSGTRIELYQNMHKVFSGCMSKTTNVKKCTEPKQQHR
jgi:hypothetical protein